MALLNNTKFGRTNASSSSFNVTIPSTTSGSLLVLLLARFDGTSNNAIASVSGGGTWTKGPEATGDANSHVEIWWAPNVSAGVTTVTVTRTTGGTGFDYEGNIHEWSGMELSATIDKNLTNTGTGTSMSIDFGTLAQAAEVLYMMGSHTGADAALTEDTADSFTLISENEDNDLGQTYLAQYKEVSSTAGPVANITIAASRSWFAAGASFKVASTGVTIAVPVSAVNVVGNQDYIGRGILMPDEP